MGPSIHWIELKSALGSPDVLASRSYSAPHPADLAFSANCIRFEFHIENGKNRSAITSYDLLEIHVQDLGGEDSSHTMCMYKAGVVTRVAVRDVFHDNCVRREVGNIVEIVFKDSMHLDTCSSTYVERC